MCPSELGLQFQRFRSIFRNRCAIHNLEVLHLDSHDRLKLEAVEVRFGRPIASF